MSWYAATPGRAWRQVLADVFVLAWVAAWWWASRVVHDAIDAVAGPVRETEAAAGELSERMSDAGSAAGEVPLVGDDLREPFDGAAGSLDGVATSSADLAATIERVADISGWVVLLIPVVTLIALWLPVRLRFLLTARASRRFIDAAPDLDLFALRAMATQPMPVLARISDDPVGAWRRGDRVVITRLAEAELRRMGLLLPDRLRPGPAGPDDGPPPSSTS